MTEETPLCERCGVLHSYFKCRACQRHVCCNCRKMTWNDRTLCLECMAAWGERDARMRAEFVAWVHVSDLVWEGFIDERRNGWAR